MLWQATNPNARDFRYAVVGGIYTSTPLTDQGGGVFRANVSHAHEGLHGLLHRADDRHAVGPVQSFERHLSQGNPPTNNPPTLQPISDLVVNEGSPLSIQAWPAIRTRAKH